MTYKGNRKILGAFLLVVLAGTITSSIGLATNGIMRAASASVAVEEENELQQENELRLFQLALAGQECEAFAAFCINAAINNAKVEQENEAEQGNVNVQTQTGNNPLAVSLIGDPEAENEQTAELENEAEQENEAKIFQLAIAGQECEGIAVFCANAAINKAEVEQENEAEQGNVNVQTQTGNNPLAASLIGDPEAENEQAAELENEAEQENEAKIFQIAVAGQECEGVAVFCANAAINKAEVEQENEAEQGNVNVQTQTGNNPLAASLIGDPEAENEQTAELENEAEQENEAKISQIAVAGQECEGIAVFCANAAINKAEVEQENEAEQGNVNVQTQTGNNPLAASLIGDPEAENEQTAELENEAEQENEAKISQIAVAGQECEGIAVFCANAAINKAEVEQENEAEQGNVNVQTQTGNNPLAASLIGDPEAENEQTAELENEAEQENEAKISQIAVAGQECEGIAVFCANAAINKAEVEQENEAEQGNVNVQTQTGNNPLAASLIGDPEAENEQTAELENEAEQENEAKISQIAVAGQECEGIAVFCANAAINKAEVEQENEAEQGNVNVQTQTGNNPLAASLIGDPEAENEQTAELENEAEQENEAKISQIAVAGQECEGIAVFCANAAINKAEVEQENEAEQGNVNVQTQTDDSNGPCSATSCSATSTVDPSDPSNTQTAELENEAEQENEAKIGQIAVAGQECEGIAVFCANAAINKAEVEQENEAEQGNVNVQTKEPTDNLGATAASTFEDPSDPSNTQTAELENEADQENEAEISQVAVAGQECEGIAVFCANAAINKAEVEQENEAEQGNVNSQRLFPTDRPGATAAASTFEDPSDPSNTQTAELENEAEQENEAKIGQIAVAGQECEGIAVFCANAAINKAEVEQENEAEQGNVNVQTAVPREDPSGATTTSNGDPNGGNTQAAELENEADQENEAKIGQIAIAGQECEGVAVYCVNSAANNADVDQENEAEQANVNSQTQTGGSGSGNTQAAELENEAEQENEAKISQIAIAGQDCKGVAVYCVNSASNNAEVEQENEAEQGNVNSQTQTGGSGSGNTQAAELENEAEQENEAKISQVAIAGQDCKGVAVYCVNSASNNAEVEQENEAEQGNVNSQRMAPSDRPGATAASTIEDPSDPSNTQTAELENEADQENEAEISQVADAGQECEGAAVFCGNVASNNADVDQENEAEQANVNSQTQEDDNDGSDTADAELENDADQGNEAGVNQAATDESGSDDESEASSSDESEASSSDESEASSSDDDESGSDDESEASSSDDDESEDDAEDAEDEAEDAEDEAEDDAEDEQDEQEDSEEE